MEFVHCPRRTAITKNVTPSSYSSPTKITCVTNKTTGGKTCLLSSGARFQVWGVKSSLFLVTSGCVRVRSAFEVRDRSQFFFQMAAKTRTMRASYYSLRSVARAAMPRRFERHVCARTNRLHTHTHSHQGCFIPRAGHQLQPLDEE